MRTGPDKARTLITAKHVCAYMLLSLIATVGCDAKNADSTLTYQQAVDRVEHCLRDATAHLHPTPTLTNLGKGDAPCGGPNDNQDTGYVMYEHTYHLDGADIKNNDAFQQMHQYWKTNGYAVVRMAGSDSSEGVRKTTVKNPATGFKMHLVQSIQGRLSLGAQSPCVPEPPS